MRVLCRLFITFLKLGLFTIGGGMAMIPLLQDEVVNRKKWLSEDEMIDCLTINQGLPGVIAVNMATYIGYAKRGIIGAIVSTVGVIMPSFVTIILIVEGLSQVATNPYVNGAIAGIKAVATGLILLAAYQVGRQTIKGYIELTAAIGTFVAIGIFGVNPIYAIVLGCLGGVFIKKLTGEKDNVD